MSAKPPDELCTARQAFILGLVIREYVETAMPVSSGRLVSEYDLGVSAATVRNELAVLESLGLLTHPYTSAGRIPTVAGYRYFVENVMTTAQVSQHERLTIRHQFHQAGWDQERWMQLSAAVMARTSGAAGFVATKRTHAGPLRRLEMVAMDDGSVHLIAVTNEGHVRQARLRPERAVDQRALNAIGKYVNEALETTGAPPSQMPTEGADICDEILATIRQLLRPPSTMALPRLYHAGLTQIMVQPEFSESEHLMTVVGILEHGFGLQPIIDTLPRSGVQVIIGGEPPLEDIPHVALVLSRFGHLRTPNGVLGVVGPTRLSYERAVPAVGFVADLMNRLVAGDAVRSD